jgi:Na+-driven multidrug efflux pump
MNKILMVFTSTATAVFGVYIKLNSFVFMPVFGLNNGMIPIISYNYGAQNRLRIKKTIILCIIYATMIMTVGFAIFQIFPETLLSFFKASPEMIEIGVPALRIISISFLMAGYGIVSGSVFQALGKGVLSMNVSLVRQLTVLLPVAWLMARTGNLHLVWWAFPLADVAAVILCTIFIKKTYNKEIRPLPEGKPA